MKNRVYALVKNMVGVYTREHVPRSAAGLSYSLMLTVFPFLICVSAILGSLNISQTSLVEGWEPVIPDSALKAINDFLNYVGGNKSSTMLVIGGTAMLTCSAAAFRAIFSIMGDIQGKPRFSGLIGTVVSFVMSVVFLAAVYLSGLVLVTGQWLIQGVEQMLGLGQRLDAWRWIRFVLLFALMFVIIYGLYVISAPREAKRTPRLPGALSAAVVLVVVSVIFSKIISATVRYELVYGALASFVVLMVWLYTCGIILIMGNVFNISIVKSRDEISGGPAELLGYIRQMRRKLRRGPGGGDPGEGGDR